MALTCTLQLSFSAPDQAMGVLNRVSGEAGKRSINDLQFQPSLSGAASRAQARAEIGIRNLGPLGGFRVLTRMRKAIRGIGGFEDERDAFQRSNNATYLIVMGPRCRCEPSSQKLRASSSPVKLRGPFREIYGPRVSSPARRRIPLLVVDSRAGHELPLRFYRFSDDA
jgi:hypothetical protein